MPRGSSTTTIEHLPDQVLGAILALAGREQGPAVTLVSRRWQHAFYSEPALWRSISLDFAPLRLLPHDQWPLWVAARYRQLRRIASWVTTAAVREPYRLEPAAAAAPFGPRLADFFEALDPQALSDLNLSCTLWSGVGQALLGLSRFTRLHSLAVHAAMLPAEMGSALSQLTQLARLRIESLSLLEPPDVVGSVLLLRQLTSLELSSSMAVLPLHMAQLTTLSQLQHLGMEHGMAAQAMLALGMEAEPPSAEVPEPVAFPSLRTFDFQIGQGLQVAGARLRGCSYSLGQHPSQGAALVGVLCLKRVERLPSLAALLSALLPAGSPLSLLELDRCQLAPSALRGCTQLAALPALHFKCCTGSHAAGGSGGGDAVQPVLEPLLQQARSLTTLSCTGSLGAGFPACLAAKAGLKKLRLWQNRLELLPAGPYLQGLELLDIGGSNLDHGRLPPALAAATALRQLVLTKSSKLKVKRDDVGDILLRMPSLEQLCLGRGAIAPGVLKRLREQAPSLTVEIG